MKTLTPYLNFPGTTEQALNFYAQALGGQILFIQRFKDMPPSGDNGLSMDLEAVLHAQFQAEGIHFMASDGPVSQASEGRVSLSINFTDAESIDKAFAALSEGGTVTMPLQDTFWNARFGMCTDKFGIAWMFNYDLVPKEAGAPETMMA